MKFPGRDVAILLGPDRLNVQRAQVGDGPESEIPCGNSLGEKSGFREGQGHVAHLHSLNDGSFLPLVIEIHVVCRGEFPGFIVVHVHVDPLRHGTGHLESELDIRLEPGEEPRITALLKAHFTGLEPSPIPSELTSPPETDSQVCELRLKEGGGFS